MSKSIQKIHEWINSKTICVSLISLFFGSCFYSCQTKKPQSDFKSRETRTDSLKFLDPEVTVFVLAKTWGLLGNHEQLSIFSDKSLDTIKLNTSRAFYRKVGGDSLIMYVPASIPKGVEKNIGEVKLRLIKLTTQAEFLDYNANYQKYGLRKISALGN